MCVKLRFSAVEEEMCPRCSADPNPMIVVNIDLTTSINVIPFVVSIIMLILKQMFTAKKMTSFGEKKTRRRLYSFLTHF